ncbi:MAG: OadG family protein [Elusimicrobiaceae bacterium]|nr:OadG family protein [Elusimicrobiaceae bacterium]
MNAENLFLQSLNITAIGMMIVFSFLILLIGMMKILGAFVAWMEKTFPSSVPATAGADNTLLAVAIAAAKKFQGK